MTMQAFHDIEALRHVCEHIKMNCEYHAIAVRPTVKFRGTCKLHGTNAGVRVTPDGGVQAQGRNRELTITADNYGFAHFVAGNAPVFKELLQLVGCGVNDDVTIYGEWCGTGIQKGVAVSKLPKMFVIFAVYNHTLETFLLGRGEGTGWLDMHEDVYLNADALVALNVKDIYLITQAKTYEVDIDFNDPNPAAELISQYTLQVEDVCPFSAMLGVEGMGEGIVWVSTGYKERLKFKSKGEKHKKGGEKTQVAVDPEKVASISALVDLLLPEWRLEQGFSYMREHNIPLTNTSTGEYLKWIAKDVLKEESDRIAANPFPWKELQGPIMQRSKAYYFDELNKAAGLTSSPV